MQVEGFVSRQLACTVTFWNTQKLALPAASPDSSGIRIDQFSPRIPNRRSNSRITACLRWARPTMSERRSTAMGLSTQPLNVRYCLRAHRQSQLGSASGRSLTASERRPLLAGHWRTRSALEGSLWSHLERSTRRPQGLLCGINRRSMPRAAARSLPKAAHAVHRLSKSISANFSTRKSTKHRTFAGRCRRVG
jgi:hypothetical protein